MERCPDCGQSAVLRRKGRPLVRCAACSLASLRARHRAYDAAHRRQKEERRRAGGPPCPAYEAWTWETFGLGVYVIYRRPAWPEASVMPAYGACSCGEAGCVHLVVACLAQQKAVT